MKDNGEDLRLAQEIIGEFRESAKDREKKRQLAKRLAHVEARYDDYKLVRGLATLLERRSRFESSVTDFHGRETASNGITGSPGAQSANPASIRRMLFEESSRAGFALTGLERDNLMQSVASKMGISESYLRQAIWSDLEENMILTSFEPVNPEELLGWYNLSLMQTLLFNCTTLEFSVRHGVNWKQVLRSVRRLGLMYELQQRPKCVQPSAGAPSTHATAITTSDPAFASASATTDSPGITELVCLVDGPLSLFKLTDRYGTSIAKLLPSIISTEEWYLHAWIVRKNMSGKKIFEFKISSSEAPPLLSGPYFRSNGEKYVERRSKSYGGGREGGAGAVVDTKSPYFDSIVEEKFANRFEQLDSGWALTREPDPIVVSGGRAFIPDFMFEKYGRKVYLEIVGFWTKQYLENKKKKLIDVLTNKSMDLFIAINEDLECSKITSSQAVSPERIIYYRNASVPVKQILGFLRKIDSEEIERHAADANLKIRFDRAMAVVSVEDVAKEFDIPVESAIRVASRDNDDDYLLAATHFILKSRASKLGKLLNGVTRFSDACSILSEHSIPESCHAELVSMLGFDVVWQSMDASSALIVRRNSANTS